MNTQDTFVIEGLSGAKTLVGTVPIHGAKNSALKAMAAAVLFDGPVTLRNVPHNDDVETMTGILTKLGAIVTPGTSYEITIDSRGINTTDIDVESAKTMRGSVVLTGPLLSRFGKVSFPAPGGCVIGTRPIDLFIDGYKKMGAQVKEDDVVYDIKASHSLKGSEIFFNKVSVGGTETLMMAAVLATGTTILKNCAMEPEIVNVAEWLNACGARIHGVGTPTITIEGTAGKLLSPSAAFVTIPDRIEAGSFLILAALCAHDVTITDCEPKHLEALITLLTDSGVEIERGEHSLRVKASSHKKSSSFKAVSSLRTHEYPGFPTDLQAQIVTFLTQVTGESIVFETIFEGRFKYVEDLTAMGAHITVMNPREIMIKGPADLIELAAGEELRAHDIRAGFAIVLAALVAKGVFTVNNVHLIDRGYEKLEDKLSAIGAKIKRVVR